MVIVIQPFVQILLKRSKIVIKLFSEIGPEKFVQNGFVESLHKSISLWISKFGIPVLDVIKFEKYFVNMNHSPAFIPGTIVDQDMHI
ncbi:MAG: hypothetical protein MI862_04660 [Desulfobacterales bacterium]|nr:hypothetical protein [Desulfobacterales bacterium]